MCQYCQKALDLFKQAHTEYVFGKQNKFRDLMVKVQETLEEGAKEP